MAGWWIERVRFGRQRRGARRVLAARYQVVRSADGKSATVQFNGTCAGITAKGTGSGSLSGTVLTWNAQGTAVRSSLVCPFSFDNSTATPEGAGIRVNYAGSVCGVPVRGSELLVR